MKLIDISWPIKPGMTQYKNRNELNFVARATFEKDGYNQSRLEMDVHTGTHVDAPFHFSGDDASGKSESLRLDQLVGTCAVFDMTHVENAISEKDLHDLPLEEHLIVLFKTQNSFRAHNDPFDPNFIYIDTSAACYLASKRVKAVGIDYLGIERNQPNHETHKTFFEAHISVIEGLRFGHVPAGAYTLLCFPLAIHGLEAAPARALLVTE